MIFCRHQWKTVEKIETKAPFEVVKELNINASSENLHSQDMHRLLTRKIVLILACGKCGKLKEYRS